MTVMDGLTPTAAEFVCPECGGSDFKRWDHRHWAIIHWLVNPGLLVNELVLGQRLPKLMLICKTCQVPLVDRSYVPCAECGTMNRGRIWSAWAGFGHWWGYVCPSCGSTIPCLWNIWSRLILAVTSPLWYLPARFIRPHWIEYERRRIGNVSGRFAGPAREIPWIRNGVLGFGGFMWVLWSAFALYRRAPLWEILAMLPIWAGAGLFFGLIMKWSMSRRP